MQTLCVLGLVGSILAGNVVLALVFLAGVWFFQ
jgi:hypothetical protein